MLIIVFSLAAVSTLDFFTCVLNEFVFEVLASWKKKKVWTSCAFLFFVSFVLIVIVFAYNRLKQNLIPQRKPNRFFTNLFSLYDSYVYLKKNHLVLYLKNWVRVSYYVHHFCLHLSLILLRKFVLILPGRDSLSHEKKKLTKLVYFLETTLYESLIF